MDDLATQEDTIRLGGGPKAIERQHEKNRLTARERIDRLVDPGTFFELGLWAAWNMYAEWGGAPSAGVVTGIGTVAGRRVMIIANDATVKAGAFFPMTVQEGPPGPADRHARTGCRWSTWSIPPGVFLPLQDEVFPDEDDFGRIFRNNAVISAAGIPQFAAIMGNCVAGGGYLPVLCDKLLMTEGSGLYLAGPALVKAAIGQDGQPRGARRRGDARGDQRHDRLPRAGRRRLPRAAAAAGRAAAADDPTPMSTIDAPAARRRRSWTTLHPTRGGVRRPRPDPRASSTPVRSTNTRRSTARRSSAASAGSAACRSASSPTSGTACKPAQGPMQFGGVIYVDSADKAARFVMDCNQTRMPLVFLQDVNGFMVGRDAEQAGIIRPGPSSSTRSPTASCRRSRSSPAARSAPGNYALCGKAFDPRFIFAWPNARYAVMGGDQAANTLLDVQVTAPEAGRQGARRGRAGRAARQGEGVVRREDRRPLRRRPAVGGPDRPAGRDAVGAADGAGGRDAARRRPGVQDGGVAGLIHSPIAFAIISAIPFASSAALLAQRRDHATASFDRMILI